MKHVKHITKDILYISLPRKAEWCPLFTTDVGCYSIECKDGWKGIHVTRLYKAPERAADDLFLPLIPWSC